MQAAFDHAVEYVHDRKQFGQPVGTFQLMQGMLRNYRAKRRVYLYRQARLRTCTRNLIQAGPMSMPWLERVTRAILAAR
jgi:alkylation response protein AidB-like acyl-CoA dehydrogenase